MYYWNLGLARGKWTVIGPYNTESEATEAGFRAFDGGNFETYELNTRDRAYATSQIKYKRHEKGMPLDEALEPVRHESVGSRPK